MKLNIYDEVQMVWKGAEEGKQIYWTKNVEYGVKKGDVRRGSWMS